MKPTVSIIIPVYNAEKYLQRTINSVYAQTFQDWELLLIDDGSRDYSRRIIEKAMTDDSRIRLIVQENMGPARARNRGLEEARGRYVSFIDADDTVEPNMLESFYTVACEKKAHIVMCNFATIQNNHRTEHHHGFICRKILPPPLLESQVLSRYFKGNAAGVPSLCTKFVDLEWLREKNILLPENRVRAEDWLFNLNCLEASPRFCAIDDVLYNYWQNEGSIMHSVREGEWRQHFESIQILQEVNRRHNFHFEQSINAQCIAGAIGHLLSLFAQQPVDMDFVQGIISHPTMQASLCHYNGKELPKTFRLLAFLLKIKQEKLAKWLMCKIAR